MEFKVRNDKMKVPVIDYIKDLAFASGITYVVKITRKRALRSPQQNKIYWLWLTCIEVETGNDKDTLHDTFREMFLGIQERVVFGVSSKRYPSTTRLDKPKFKRYLDQIQTFASTELGITLPDPDSQYWEEFIDHYSKYAD